MVVRKIFGKSCLPSVHCTLQATVQLDSGHYPCLLLRLWWPGVHVLSPPHHLTALLRVLLPSSLRNYCNSYLLCRESHFLVIGKEEKYLRIFLLWYQRFIIATNTNRSLIRNLFIWLEKNQNDFSLDHATEVTELNLVILVKLRTMDQNCLAILLHILKRKIIKSLDSPKVAFHWDDSQFMVIMKSRNFHNYFPTFLMRARKNIEPWMRLMTIYNRFKFW